MNKKADFHLEGKWKVIGCQLNGIWLPPPIFDKFIYEFPDLEHFKLAWGELSYGNYMGGFPKSDHGAITLNLKEQPHAIDLIPATGPFAGKPFKGILELDHDILKAIFSIPGQAAERPKTFQAQNGQVYEIWQRL
ncbi:hypothetical protein PHSC3_000867 [Chlamydiales bacterium STE3]|nr:hypothetical protein PHSC3_000867 [Chlamydiales bacterium STE3]